MRNRHIAIFVFGQEANQLNDKDSTDDWPEGFWANLLDERCFLRVHEIISMLFKLKVLSDSHYVLSGQFLSYVSQCIDSYMKENWRIYKNSGIQG